MGQGTRVGQDNLGEVSRLGRILSSGHFATNVKDDIWVIVMIPRDAITMEELVIWPETVRTIIIVQV